MPVPEAPTAFPCQKYRAQHGELLTGLPRLGSAQLNACAAGIRQTDTPLHLVPRLRLILACSTTSTCYDESTIQYHISVATFYCPCSCLSSSTLPGRPGEEGASWSQGARSARRTPPLVPDSGRDDLPLNSGGQDHSYTTLQHSVQHKPGLSPHDDSQGARPRVTIHSPL